MSFIGAVEMKQLVQVRQLQLVGLGPLQLEEAGTLCVEVAVGALGVEAAVAALGVERVGALDVQRLQLVAVWML